MVQAKIKILKLVRLFYLQNPAMIQIGLEQNKRTFKTATTCSPYNKVFLQRRWALLLGWV